MIKLESKTRWANLPGDVERQRIAKLSISYGLTAAAIAKIYNSKKKNIDFFLEENGISSDKFYSTRLSRSVLRDRLDGHITSTKFKKYFLYLSDVAKTDILQAAMDEYTGKIEYVTRLSGLSETEIRDLLDLPRPCSEILEQIKWNPNGHAWGERGYQAEKLNDVTKAVIYGIRNTPIAESYGIPRKKVEEYIKGFNISRARLEDHTYHRKLTVDLMNGLIPPDDFRDFIKLLTITAKYAVMSLLRNEYNLTMERIGQHCGVPSPSVQYVLRHGSMENKYGSQCNASAA